MADLDGPSFDLAEIERREQLIASLLHLAAKHRREYKAAGKRLNRSLVRLLDRQRAEIRESVRRRRDLLKVAHEYVLDEASGRRLMDSISDLPNDQKRLPRGFTLNCLGCHAGIPVRMKRCHEVIGRYDVDLDDELWVYVGYLRNALLGRWGEYALARKVNLKRTNGVDAYVRVLSTAVLMPGTDHPRRAHRTRLEALEDVDVRVALRFRVSLAKALEVHLGYTLDEWEGESLSKAACWDIFLLVIVLLHPDFDHRHAGVMKLPPWKDDPDHPVGWMQTRYAVLALWASRGEEAVKRLSNLVARAVKHVAGSDVAPRQSRARELDTAALADAVAKTLPLDILIARINEQLQSVPCPGWTQKELCKNACISDELFMQIRGAADLRKRGRGEHSSRYARLEVEQLIRAARIPPKGKREWLNTARCWEEMLGDRPPTNV